MQTTRPNVPARTSNDLVERAARQALRDAKPKRDLLRDGIPFRPGLWNIVVEPREPKTTSEGGIEYVQISQQAEAFQITIGRVLLAGPACMEGKTTSGIELCNFLPDIKTPDALIGQHVIFQLHTGMSLTLRASEQRIIVMKVTDLLGVTDDPDAWKFYI
jgi:co-chaperonin GroES (HSP10)